MADNNPAPKKESPYKDDAFYKFIEGNTDRDPRVYYNLAAYVALYNRIRGDLQNEFDGDSTTFDTVINRKIREGLGGVREDGTRATPAEVKAFLRQAGFEGLFKVYDTPDELKAAKDSKHFDYQMSSDYICQPHNFEEVVGMARALAGQKYGSEEGRMKQMLTYRDAERIMQIKEEKSDKTHYTAAKDLISNIGLFGSDGKLAGGPITKALTNANEKLKGMTRNIRIGTLKAIGWAALTIGAGVATGGLGIAALGLGGQAMAGAFGALYTVTQAAGTLVSLAFTALTGAITAGGLSGFLKRIGQNYKNRRERFRYKHSLGKYATADADAWDKMGYGRLNNRFEQFKSIKLLYDNFQAGKPVQKKYRRVKGHLFKREEIPFDEYEAIDFVPKPYRRAFREFVREQPEFFGEGNIRDISTIFKNAHYHRLVHDKNVKPGEIAYGNLSRMLSRNVEGYEVSDNSSDEVLYNYGDGIDGRTGNKGLLHDDRIKGSPKGELDYITGVLNQYVGEKKKFDDTHKESDYRKGLMLFAGKYNDTFSHVLFEKAFSSADLNAADSYSRNKKIQELFEDTDPAIATRIESMLKFVQSEASNESRREYPMLSEDVGVGVQYQLDFSESSLLAGCASIGGTSDDVKEAAKELAKMNAESKTTAVKNKINALPSGPAKEYLMHMFKSKKLSVVRDDIPEFSADTKVGTSLSIARLIKGMTSVSQVDAIKRKISIQLAGDAAQRQIAIDMLDDQARRLASKAYDEARLNAMGAVREGSVVFTEIMKEIAEYKDLAVASATALKDKIATVRPKECREYLMCKLKDRIGRLCYNYANEPDNFGKEGLNDIRVFLSKLFTFVDSGMLDAWQRDEILEGFNTENAVPAFNELLRNMTIGYFTTEPREDIEKLSKMLGQPFKGGGFKQFLDLDDPDAQNIKKRLERILAAKNNDITKYITSKNKVEDPNSSDLQAFLRIYFEEDRPSDNKLIKVLDTLRSHASTAIDSNHLEYIVALPGDNTAFDGTSDTSIDSNLDKSFASKILDELGNFNSDGLYEATGADAFTLSPEDSMAVLIIMKRRMLAKMKEHLKVLSGKHGSTFSNFLTTNDSYYREMETRWKRIAQEIDNAIALLRSKHAFRDGYFTDATSVSGVTNQFMGAKEIMNFIDSDSLGLSK